MRMLFPNDLLRLSLFPPFTKLLLDASVIEFLERGDCIGLETSLFLVCFLEGEASCEVGEEIPVVNGGFPG